MSGINSKHLALGSVCPELNPDRITIFNMRYCPYAQRALLVALAKNLDFDNVNIDLSSKPDWYVTKHPLTQVPSLQKGDFKIIESLVVAEYLDEKFPEPKLGPDTPEQKALDAGLISLYQSKVLNNFYKLVYNPSPEATEAFLTGLAFLEEELQVRRKSTPFFGGERVRLIDYNIWPWWERIKALESIDKVEIDWSKFPLLAAWIDRMEEDPTVKKYRVPNDIMVKFLESTQAKKTRYDFMDGNKL